MNQSGRPRRRGPVIGAALLGLLLAALMVYPWPRHQAEPIIAGVIPAPLLFWIIWTALFVGYVAWMVYRWDPYAEVVRRSGLDAAPLPPQSSADPGTDAGHGNEDHGNEEGQG